MHVSAYGHITERMPLKRRMLCFHPCCLLCLPPGPRTRTAVHGADSQRLVPGEPPPPAGRYAGRFERLGMSQRAPRSSSQVSEARVAGVVGCGGSLAEAAREASRGKGRRSAIGSRPRPISDRGKVRRSLRPSVRGQCRGPVALEHDGMLNWKRIDSIRRRISRREKQSW